MNHPKTPKYSGTSLVKLTNESRRTKPQLYLKMQNCGLDKPGIELEVIEALPFLHFQALL